jgi:hypothetical protein
MVRDPSNSVKAGGAASQPACVEVSWILLCRGFDEAELIEGGRGCAIKSYAIKGKP